MNERGPTPPRGYFLECVESDNAGEGLPDAWDRLRPRTPEEEAESNEAVQFMARLRREHPEIEDGILNDPAFIEFLLGAGTPEREQ